MPEKHTNSSRNSTNKICDHRKINKTNLPLVPKNGVNRKKKINQSKEFVSSKDRKRDHESSKDVLPPQDTPTDDLYLKSSYTVDFNKKEGQPACTRPCSVTRRNRPHPLMDFLIPQNIKHKVNKQRFYDDYVGRCSIDYSHNSKDASCSPIPAVKMDKHHNNMIGRQVQRTFPPTTEPQYNMKKATEEFEIWMNTITGSRLPNINEAPKKKVVSPLKTNVPLCMTKEAAQNFSKWVKTCTARDRKIVTDLMDAGDRGYLAEFLESTIHPSAIASMQEWFRKCEDEERTVAMDFLKSVRKLPDLQVTKISRGIQKDSNWFQPRNYRQPGQQHTRTIQYEKIKPFGIEGKRTLLEKRPLRNKPCFSHREIRVYKKQKGVKPKYVDYSSHIVSNKGSVFMQPHKKLQGYFEIHPEFSASFAA